MLDRRDFLHLAGLGAGGAYLLPRLSACGDDGGNFDPIDLGPMQPKRLPASLLGGSAAELDIELGLLAGKLPTDMYGHMFMIAPVTPGNGVHLFAGEGMLYRLDLAGGRVAVKSRIMKTPCWYADQAVAGTDDKFTYAGLAKLSGKLGFRATPNTTPVPFGQGRMLVAVDAARPYEVDPSTLELVTPMGAASEWRGGLPAGLFSGPFQPIFTLAHPYYDAHTDETFAVNYTQPFPGTAPYVALVRWDGASALETFQLKAPDGSPVAIAQSAHQIVCSRDHVLVMDTAFIAEAEQVLGQSTSRAQAPDTVIYLVRRADLKAGGGDVEARKVVIPREAAHIVCDYDDAGGKITVHLAHLCATDLSEWLRADDKRAADAQTVRGDLLGMFGGATDVSWIGRHVIDATTGQVTASDMFHDDRLSWATLYYMHRGAMNHDRFSSMYYASFGLHADNTVQRLVDLYAPYAHRTSAVNALPLSQGRPGALFRLDVASMKIVDSFELPDGRVMSSPQFAPRDGKSGDTDGYMVCTVSSDDATTPGSSGDEIWIFDAANLRRGPVCRLGAPELQLGFTIHTAWTESVAPRTASYAVKARADYGEAVAKLDPSLQQVFEQQVFPRFGG